MFKKIMLGLVLLTAPQTLIAQKEKESAFNFRAHYAATIIGGARINGITGGYINFGIAAKSKTFIIAAMPTGLLWTDSSAKYNATLEAMVKAPKTPVYVGIGQRYGFGASRTFASVSWWGEKVPFTVQVSMGKKYIVWSFSLTPKI